MVQERQLGQMKAKDEAHSTHTVTRWHWIAPQPTLPQTKGVFPVVKEGEENITN